MSYYIKKCRSFGYRIFNEGERDWPGCLFHLYSDAKMVLRYLDNPILYGPLMSYQQLISAISIRLGRIK